MRKALNQDAPKALTKTIQLSEMLTREIAVGRYPDGTRLPTERQMAENLGVAVGTLRRSLSILEDRGLLRRIQGSGNYIRVQPEIESMYEFFRLELLDGGGTPTADVLSVRKIKKSERVPNIGPGSLAHCIRRIRYLEAIPVEVEEIWLDGRFIDQIEQHELQDSLYNYYKETLNVVIGSVTDTIGVCEVPSWAPDFFGLAAGSPCGLVERIGYDLTGEPVEFSQNWFNQNVCRYTNRLGKRQAS